MIFYSYLICTALISLAYYLLLWQYRCGWNKLPDFEIPSTHQPLTRLSILIAVRNEAANIRASLQAVLSQQYPARLMELLVIDDHSTDQTARIVASIKDKRLKLISLKEGKGKKAAIAKGVTTARGELILCTDADCLVPPGWLRTMASFYEIRKAKFIAAPVNFHQERTHFERFQSLDILGMMGVTGAGIQSGWMHMCNGANLAYPKVVFEQVGGFKGIDGKASGDDMLLMQKIAKRYPGRIGFVKNPAAAVRTAAMPDWASFFQQRLRWASKSAQYTDRLTIVMLAVALLCCLNLVASLLLVSVWGAAMLWVFGGQLLLKSLADYRFLYTLSSYFKRRDLMKSFVYAQLMHIGYIVTIGLLANLIRHYWWKGRRLR